MVCQARLRQTLDSHQMDPSTNDPPTMAMRSEAVAGCTLMPHSCRSPPVAQQFVTVAANNAPHHGHAL